MLKLFGWWLPSTVWGPKDAWYSPPERMDEKFQEHIEKLEVDARKQILFRDAFTRCFFQFWSKSLSEKKDCFERAYWGLGEGPLTKSPSNRLNCRDMARGSDCRLSWVPNQKSLRLTWYPNQNILLSHPKEKRAHHLILMGMSRCYYHSIKSIFHTGHGSERRKKKSHR